jgi:glucosylceramidase
MSRLRTRREVVKMAGAGMAAATAARIVPAAARTEGEQAPPGGAIRVRRTYADKRFADEGSVQWQSAGGGGRGAIRLDPGKTFQEVLGFGASLTDAACYMIARLSPAARAALLRELFHPSELNFSVSRVCIGSSDYATEAYSYDDGEPDPELARFSIDHDRTHVVPVLAEARAVNPDLFLLASPWSPPGWMKANNSMLGGSMRSRYYAAYARYFVRFLKAYEAAGVRIDAVTPQNEVDTDQDGRMPACLWGQEYEIAFISRHLGPQIERSGLPTRIWFLDHNYNLWGRAICTLEHPDVEKYVDGVAWHGYAGRPDMMTRVHEAFPGKHMYWTEGGPDYTDRAYLTDWARWSATFANILRNWARCIIGWNLALDERGRPNIGPFTCGGIVTINSASLDVVRSGMYWALAHYSRAVRRGARRIESDGSVDGVSHVAFAHADGKMAVILTNARAETTVRLELAGKSAQVLLPADSVTSLTWV